MISFKGTLSLKSVISILEKKFKMYLLPFLYFDVELTFIVRLDVLNLSKVILENLNHFVTSNSNYILIKHNS